MACAMDLATMYDADLLLSSVGNSFHAGNRHKCMLWFRARSVESLAWLPHGAKHFTLLHVVQRTCGSLAVVMCCHFYELEKCDIRRSVDEQATQGKVDKTSILHWMRKSGS